MTGRIWLLAGRVTLPGAWASWPCSSTPLLFAIPNGRRAGLRAAVGPEGSAFEQLSDAQPHHFGSPQTLSCPFSPFLNDSEWLHS